MTAKAIHQSSSTECSLETSENLANRYARRVQHWRVRFARAVRRIELGHYRAMDRCFSWFERIGWMRRRTRKVHRGHDFLASLAFGSIELGILGAGHLIAKLLGERAQSKAAKDQPRNG